VKIAVAAPSPGVADAQMVRRIASQVREEREP
jgi:hypothetical protein